MIDFVTVYNGLYSSLLGWGAAVITLALVGYGARWIMRLLSPPED